MNYVFDWDPAKAALNFRKHGVRFETAMQVFDDSFAVYDQDRIVDGERRWQIIGSVGGISVFLVAYYTEDMDDGFEYVRIIPARRAERSERKIDEDSFIQNRH